MANEKRLIAYEAVYQYAFEGAHGGGLEDEDFDAIINAIDSVPTVDAVEAVHAKWGEVGVADYKCSRCGFRFTSADPISMFQYCRCGAKMDGDGQ